MADRLERVGDLQPSGDHREIADLTLQASKWLVSYHSLNKAFNRLSSTGSLVGIYPKSTQRWQDAIRAATQLAAAFRKLGSAYLDLCDAERGDGKKCATVIPPGIDHCPQEHLHY